MGVSNAGTKKVLADEPTRTMLNPKTIMHIYIYKTYAKNIGYLLLLKIFLNFYLLLLPNEK